MNKKMNLIHPNELSEHDKIAIIYSVDELFYYIVEIKKGEESYFIGLQKNPDKFGNLGDAKNACKKHHVSKAFLALSKTYQEVDGSCDNAPRLTDRYDYSEISLD